MTSAPFEYWTPGSEERRLRIFISHRYGQDEALYSQVIDALNREGFSVQDVSLSASQLMAGPRGGNLPKMEIQAQIAARIYTSDILIAPSSSQILRSAWVTWEVQLAAIGYGIPVLFASKSDQQRTTSLVKQISDLGLPCEACNPVTQEIVYNVIRLVEGRPTWAMRQEENEPNLRFRGPPQTSRDDVLRKFPFQPRLTMPESMPPPPKRGFWGGLFH